MLLELAIGDTYGVGFEYRPKDFVIKNNNLEKYFAHERYKSLYKRYSDDTQMSLGIAELMIEHKEWTDGLIANKFLEVFKRDIRYGYSSTFYNLLQSVDTGFEFIAQINPNNDRSGAAMRAGPIGLYPTTEEVLKKSEQQARLTHQTVDGVKPAQAVSLAVHYFAYSKGHKRGIGKYIESLIGGNWDEPWNNPVGEKGWMSVRAAITSIKRNSDMASLLKDCIAFTGDVDTVAAIALGIASFCSEIKNNLPKWLYDELENNTYGKDYLLEVDKKLLFSYPLSEE